LHFKLIVMNASQQARGCRNFLLKKIDTCGCVCCTICSKRNVSFFFGSDLCIVI